MRRLLLAFIVLTSMFGTAVAQRPAMINNGQDSTQLDNQDKSRDPLDVQIVSFLDNEPLPSGPTCPFYPWVTTRDTYSWYLWESNYNETPGMGAPDMPFNGYDAMGPGYIKVTVGDDNGNVGIDSVWLDILNVHQMEDFVMEVGEDLHPTFSGTVASEHTEIILYRENHPGNTGYQKNIQLSPGPWSWRDEDALFNDENLWLYTTLLYDTCQEIPLMTFVPGAICEVIQSGTEWFLEFRTLVQGTSYYHENYGVDFAYVIYTIDENGNRHPFQDENGQLVILNKDEERWQISWNPDPYFQIGIVSITDRDYQLLSLTKKVGNPYYEGPYTFNEQDERGVLSVYPNPSKGSFTVEGTGQLRVSNMLGQSVMTMEIDGKAAIELPQGLYFVKMGGKTRKIVVE